MIQRMEEGCENEESRVPLRSGMAAASIVPWTDLYEEEEEDGSRHLHISRRMGKQRYNPETSDFLVHCFQNFNCPETETRTNKVQHVMPLVEGLKDERSVTLNV